MNISENLAVAFVDMSGFTALTEVHGDYSAAGFAEGFISLTRKCLGADDRLVKSIGDAVLFTSASPQGAVAAIGKIIDATHEADRHPVLRAGVHYGPLVRANGDIYGVTVNVAARLCAAAAPGQTLATAPVATAAETSGVAATRLGPTTLRNISEPVAVFAIGLDSDCHCGQIDPVCRMRLPSHTTATERLHDGIRYRFCSSVCARRFASRPTLFAQVSACPQASSSPRDDRQ